MNKFFKKAAILAFGLGVAMTFTACHSGEGESLPTETITSADGLSYDLIVELNMAPKSITYNGASGKLTGSNIYAFNGVTKDMKLVVEAPSGYKSDYATGKVVSFGNETAKYIYINLYPDMTDASNPEYDATVVKTQAEMNTGGSTTNSSANQSNNDGTVVTLEIPAGSGDVEGDDPFSIYLYTPGETEDNELEKQDDVAEVSVLAIACTPDGASWEDKPEDQRPLVKAVLDKSSQLDVKLVNSVKKSEALPLQWNNAANPDETSVRIPHFSSWYYMLNAKVVNVKTEEVTLYNNPKRSVASGKRTQISYTRNLGIAASDANQPLLIKKYIQVLFGNNATTIKSTYNYTPSMSGLATETIKQVKKTLTIQSKNYSFDVTVWGAIKPEIIIYPSTHSGGANE